MVIADLDMRLVTKRKRMMDSVGHYARPELLHLVHDKRPAKTVCQILPQDDFEHPQNESPTHAEHEEAADA